MVQPASDTTAALHARVDINEFVLQHRRLPRIDDEIPPWDYRGWLLWHCQLAHWHPEVVNRWDYYQRTLEAGRLLDEQIPRITFSDGGSNEAVRILQRALDPIFGELGSWAAFPVLVDWIARAWPCRRKGRTSEQSSTKRYTATSTSARSSCVHTTT